MASGSVILTLENNPNCSVPSASVEKQRSKSTKQLTWVLLLRVKRAISFLSWAVLAFGRIIGAEKLRVFFIGRRTDAEEPHKRGRMLVFLKAFLAVSIVALVIEIYAYFNGWNLNLANTMEVTNLAQRAYQSWISFRGDYIAPLVTSLSKFCVVLFMMQSLDRFMLCLGCFWIKCRRLKPAMRNDASGFGDCSYFPMVLVQIPMCNEMEVFEQSICSVCQLDWPKDRLLIQVLDDSDAKIVQNLIKNEVTAWSKRGVNIVYRHRFFRTGYKAGNLKFAMACDYVKDYEFVAIFDADFQPDPDFLKKTVPYFKDNPELGLVQARWAFVNKDENLLTKLQNVNLSFHFEVEQQVNGIFLNFFGFNGTAGVWRIKTLEDAGGWLERTTVEDMDIAVRAHLKGWKFIFLNDVKALCELPESFEAYKKQQHRWHSGPMQLFRLCFPTIISSKIPVWKKLNLVFLFFLLRKLILPFYSFTLFCIILPLTMFIPEAELPVWVICYVPVFMTLLNILPSPKSFPFVIPYLLFENTMSVTKFSAMVSGLFQLGSSYEWIVTKKTGRTSDSDLLAIGKKESEQQQFSRSVSERNFNPAEEKEEEEEDIEGLTEMKKKKKKSKQVHRKELVLAFLLLAAATRSLLFAHGVHFYFLLFQGISFLVVGLDLIGG